MKQFALAFTVAVLAALPSQAQQRPFVDTANLGLFTQLEPILGLCCFFLDEGNLMDEVVSRFGPISFAIVGAN